MVFFFFKQKTAYEMRISDWSSDVCSSDLYGPIGLTPNPMIFAGVLTQIVKRAKIALLGPNVPILNPVRVAEEYAMIDTLTDGRLVAEIGRASCRERARQYVTISVVPDDLKKKINRKITSTTIGHLN